MADESKPILRLGLKRLDPVELVMGDALLRRSPFIRALGAERDSVLRASAVRRLSAGMRVWGPGDRAREVLFIVAGRLQVCVKDGAEAIAAAELTAGELAGAGAVMGRQDRGHVVVCASDADVLVWDAAELALLAHVDPGLAAVFEQAAQREEQAADELGEFLDRW